MSLRRRPEEAPVGLGAPSIPYDQSGGSMPGMNVPEPGGSMKKMSFEFTDPAQAAAQQAAMPQGGIPPTGMQQQGEQQQQDMQAPPTPQPSPSMLAGMNPQGGMSDQMSDQDLQALLGQDDPMAMMGQDMSSQLLGGGLPPQQMQQGQDQLMEAARRRLGGF